MSRTLWSTALAAGLIAGVAAAPPSAFAGGHSYTSTTIGVSNYGGYHGSAGYGFTYARGYGHGWDHDRHYWRHHGYGHSYYHGHHGTADALLGFMIGALAVGVIASAQDRDPGPAYSEAPDYAPPPQDGLGCHTVNRIGPDSTGRTVKFAATMCYDRSGTPYIAPGTQHIIERY